MRKFVVTVPRAITSECFVSLFSHTNFSKMSALTVSNSYSLDDSALHAVSRNCPLLEELAIPGCRRVTDIGLEEIISSCRGLLRLNLFSTRSIVSNVFRLLPELLPNLELLIYKPVDKQSVGLPEEVLRMPRLVFKSVYRYR